MSYIKKIPLDQAEGKLKQIYDAGLSRVGEVAQIIQLMSLDERVVANSMQFYMALMKSDNALSPARREMLATVVSNINDCYY
ncbi:MAG: hypothetical protein O7G85_09370 [Planctomycetota bacterium]|nr:hypothetical protein [Planctomycetota bacterium]